MATAYKILGQSAPSATTPTDLYTVPADTQAIASIMVTNRSTSTTFRLSLRDAGEGAANKQYLAYDTPIAANTSVTFSGIALSATDVITVYAGSANMSFTATGVEFS